MQQNKKQIPEPEPKQKEAPGMIIKTNKNDKIKQSHSKSPIRNILAGKIVPRSQAQQLIAESMSSEASKNRCGSPNEIHSRLYELHNLDKLKREKNEAIRKDNIK